MRRTGIALVAAVALFTALACDLAWHGPVTTADPAVSTWLHAHLHPVATMLLWGVTWMHSTIGLSIMSAGITVLLLATHRARHIGWLLLTVQGGQLLNIGVKDLFQRARPHFDDPLVTLGSYSFPSGHAAGSTVFWSFVVMLAGWWPASVVTRRLLTGMGVAMVLLTSLSRVYLGAHYLSDVIAGMGEGLAWACACKLLHDARTMRA